MIERDTTQDSRFYEKTDCELVAAIFGMERNINSYNLVIQSKYHYLKCVPNSDLVYGYG